MTDCVNFPSFFFLLKPVVPKAERRLSKLCMMLELTSHILVVGVVEGKTLTHALTSNHV